MALFSRGALSAVSAAISSVAKAVQSRQPTTSASTPQSKTVETNPYSFAPQQSTGQTTTRYEAWKAANPGYYVSSQDDSLARTNQDSANSLSKFKGDYYNAYKTGNQQAMSAANAGLEAERKRLGGYLAGTSGNGYIFGDNGMPLNAAQNVPQMNVVNPYTFANTETASMMHQNNDLARDLYQKMTEQGVVRLNAEKGDVNTAYNDAATQAYISYKQGERMLPQQMAALGMTGGASESAMIGARSGYENSVNTANMNRQKAIQDIELAVSQLISSGDIQTAQYILSNADKIAENYSSATQADIARQDLIDQQNRLYGMQEADITGMYKGKPTMAAQNSLYDMQSNNYQTKIDLAKIAAQVGDYSLLKRLGITANLKATESGKGRSGRGGGNGSSNGYSYAPTTTEQQRGTSGFTKDYDMASILALGKGPMTLSSLEALIKSGQVGVKQEGGKIKVFWKNTATTGMPSSNPYKNLQFM